MDRGRAIKELKALQQSRNYEVPHMCADEILTELLESLGYEDVVQEWEKVGKWYA